MGEYDIDARAIAGALETGCMQINDPGLLQALEHTIGRKIEIKVPMNPGMMDSEILLKRMGVKQTPPPRPIESKTSVNVKVPPSGEK